MIGQESILEKISYQVLNKSLSHTILLLGEHGCGKHTLANIIANDLLNIIAEDITEDLSLEKLTEIQLCPIQKLYIINGNKVDFKKQNTLLKFFEEPLVNSYIVLLAESKLTLLATIINRCQIYQMNSYTIDQLKSITHIDNEVILRYCNTPGKIFNFENVDINVYLNYIDRMLTLLARASWANILRLSENMYFNDKEKNDSKFSFNLIITLLKDRASELYVNKQISFMEYQRIVTFVNDLRIPNINKKQLFENFIFSLKGALV